MSELLKKNVIHRFLSNGMEVYLESNDFAPIVSLQVVVKAGSIDEESSEAGLAHVLEHMLFKGTKKYPAVGQVASTVEFQGGDINAYTTFDHTNYHLTAPAHFTLEGVELLLDVVQNSLLDQEELDRELPVILEEISRGKDNPNHVASQGLFSLVYPGEENRMGRPVIGFREIVENLSRDKVFAFYKKWYKPNNMAFIAIGDFNVQEVFAALEKLSASFPPGAIPERFRPAVSFALDRPQVQILRGPWQEARIQFAVPAPSLEQEEMPVWDVLASILGGSDSSRLVTSIRDERQLVTAIGASSYTPKYPYGFLSINFFSMAETAKDAIKAILCELIRLAEVPPNSEELQRVLNALRLQRIYERESMDGIARSLGMSLLTAKKLRFDEEYMERVLQVTTGELQQLALKMLNYFASGSFALVAVLGQDVLSAETAEGLRDLVINTAQISSSLAPRASLEEFTHRVSAKNEQVKQLLIPLPQGKSLHINYRENARLPLTSGMLIFRGGLGLEPPGKNGVGSLCAALLTRGTKEQSYRKFIEELEDISASISAFSSRDTFGLRFDSLTEKSLRVLQMTLDTLFRPEFSEEEWKKIYKETEEMLVAQKDNPVNKLSRITQPLLFHDHFYSNSNAGTLESLQNITLEDVKNFWSQLFSAQEFIVSLSGEFSLEAITHMLQTEFNLHLASHPEQNSTFSPVSVAPLAQGTPRVASEVFEREQAHVSLACLSCSLRDDRRIPLEVAAALLAGQSGRLFLDLRDKRSLAYTVSASHAPSLYGGTFSAYIATSAQKVQEALVGLKSHIEQLAKEPPQEEELLRAKRSLIGSQSISAQHYSYQVSQLAMSDVYSLGFDNFLNFADRINAVTAEQVSDVLRAILKENAPVITVVGPQNSFVPEQNDPLLRWDI